MLHKLAHIDQARTTDEAVAKLISIIPTFKTIDIKVFYDSKPIVKPTKEDKTSHHGTITRIPTKKGLHSQTANTNAAATLVPPTGNQN